MKISRVAKLGSGSQGDVYKVKMPIIDSYLVAKTRKIFNNDDLAR